MVLFSQEILAISDRHLSDIYQIHVNKDLVDKEEMKNVNSEFAETKYFMMHGEQLVSVESPQAAANSSKGSSSEGAIALIAIVGAMQKSATWWYRSTSTVAVRNQIAMADNDPNVSSIMLYIDSGGGTVTGTHELAKAIKDTKKPVIACVSDTCASAAVWVASQADEIYCTSPVGNIGSIDVLTWHTDYSVYYESFGIKMMYITSDLSRNKVLGNEVEPLTEETQERIRMSLVPCYS